MPPLPIRSHFADGAPAFDALETLRSLLALPALPRRIECFDISTFQGAETVASMVVMVEGRLRKSDYRKYRIRPETTGNGPSDRVLDDFALDASRSWCAGISACSSRAVRFRI